MQANPRIRWSEKDESPTSGRAELLRKARAFADPDNGYSPVQFEQLCRMCRKHGFALGMAAVIRLLTVRDRRQREALQRRAIKGHWTNERGFPAQSLGPANTSTLPTTRGRRYTA